MIGILVPALASATLRLRGSRRLRFYDDLLESRFHTAQHGLRAWVVSLPHRCYRFLQIRRRLRDFSLHGAQSRAGEPGPLRGKPRTCLREKSSDLGQRPLDVTANARPRLRSITGGVLGVLAALEGEVQCQTVVALNDGLVGLFQRRRGGGVLRRCVLLGAGRAGGVDRPLRLTDFFVGGLGARGHHERGKQPCRGAGPWRPSTHQGQSIDEMKDMAPHDRPREKLERLGATSLGDNELLAIVLGTGSRHGDALDLANRLLDHAGGLYGLTRIGTSELRRVGGIGFARATQVLAAVELGRRTLVRGVAERPWLGTPRQLAAYLLPQYGSQPVEQFGIVMLDTKHRVIRVKLVSVGSLDTTIVHPREVFREAASASAAAIVLFHNHPSGDPTPSTEDLVLTTRMVNAGDVMGIHVVDHLILADQRYFSLVEAGRLTPRAE